MTNKQCLRNHLSQGITTKTRLQISHCLLDVKSQSDSPLRQYYSTQIITCTRDARDRLAGTMANDAKEKLGCFGNPGSFAPLIADMWSRGISAHKTDQDQAAVN